LDTLLRAPFPPTGSLTPESLKVMKKRWGKVGPKKAPSTCCAEVGQ
jgi:hypothetical protein